MHRSNLKVMRRPGPELRVRWGIFSPSADHWVDVLYGTREEADLALSILTQIRPRS